MLDRRIWIAIYILSQVGLGINWRPLPSGKGLAIGTYLKVDDISRVIWFLLELLDYKQLAIHLVRPA